MKVLITGNAGFIGSNLSQRCLDERWSVTGVDNLSNGHIEFVPDLVDHYTADFASDTTIELIKRSKFDVVVHLAAVPRVGYSVEHPLETNETNVSKTLRLIDACRGNVGRFVFASSSSVYGGALFMPTRTTHPKDPKSPYALQKSIIEDYLKLYSNLYGLDSVCLRFFNVFGPNQLGDSPYATAIGAWLTAIKQSRPMRSDGDGEQTRDMCYVDNVTDACVKAATKPGQLSAQCYNVACGENVSNNMVLDYMMKRYPGVSKIDAPSRPGDVRHTLADISQTRIDLGYEPLIRVWDGVQRTCDWYDQHWSVIKNMGLNK